LGFKYEVDDEQRYTASLVSGENEGDGSEETGRSGAREHRISLFLLPILLIAFTICRS